MQEPSQIEKLAKINNEILGERFRVNKVGAHFLVYEGKPLILNINLKEKEIELTKLHPRYETIGEKLRERYNKISGESWSLKRKNPLYFS